MSAAVAPATSLGVDGRDGRAAWRVLAAALAVHAVCVGTVASHGVTVGFLDDELGVTGGGAVLLVATATLLQFGLGPVAGALCDRVGPRSIVRNAAAVYAGGLIAASLLRPAMVAVVVCGVSTGVAGALVLTPLMATTSGWFERKRLTAVAALVAGNGAAAFLFAPLTAALIGDVGLRWTWALLGTIGGAAVALAARGLVRSPYSPAADDHPEQPPLFAEQRFRRFYAAIVITTAGALVPPALLVPAATEQGLLPHRAALVLGAAHLAGVVTRIAVTFLVRPATVQRHFRRSQLLLAATFLLWASAGTNRALLGAFAVVYGASFGAWAALSPAVIVSAYRDRLALRIGALYTAPGIGGFVGPLLVTQLAGAPADVTATALLAGAAVALGALLAPHLDAPHAAQA